MNIVRRCSFSLFGLALAVSFVVFLGPRASAQIVNVVFSEDFEGPSIDPDKFQPDAPFFEGGLGDIQATQANGVVEFTGTVSQQWWAGATLRVVPTFTVSEEANVAISVDRVSENGVGTASRSALWIMDETQTKYVLFADVRGEGGWHYNRKIGEAGDVATGGGNNIAAFDGGTYDDLWTHRMKAVADGKNVSLYLDDVFGARVKFPFSTLVFHIGSYARANGDTAGTVFDNLTIETIGTATFSATALTLGRDQTASDLTVRIPPGANATTAISLRVVSSAPAVAIPVGAPGGTLTLTFAAGAPNTQTFGIQAVAAGGARFTLENDIGLAAGNELGVVVVEGPGVRLTEDFSGGAIDAAKWEVNNQGFEAGVGQFEVTQTGGALEISGWLDQAQYWGGASLRTVNGYTAAKDQPLSFEVDRVSIDRTTFLGEPSTAARTGVYITTADRNAYVFFGQDLGETGWEVNVNPGNPTGSGTTLAPFASLADDLGNHRMRLLADGETVEVFLDGQSGGRFDFAVGSGIVFELGAYARALNDEVKGVFDNVKIENVLPCIAVSPPDIDAVLGDTGNIVTVTIPKMLNAVTTKVTVTSRDPSVAIPVGAVGGALTLTYATGSTNVQKFEVRTVGVGTTTFDVTNDQGACVGNGVAVTVTPAPVVLFSDNFDSGAINDTDWQTDATPLVEGGAATPGSGISVTDGVVLMDATCDDLTAIRVTLPAADWPGFALFTKASYSASATSPVVFAIDRTKMEYVLVGGTSAKQRTGVWIKDAAGNYLFFSEFGSWSGAAGGWQYHRVTGQTGDVPLGDPNATGVYLAEFNAAQYTDQQNHRLKVVANGTTVKLYLDDVRGAEVPFPFSEGLVFGFGSYVNFGNNGMNIVRGYWDNAEVQGYPEQPPQLGPLTVAQAAGNIVISWTGAGTLQSTDSLNPINWTDVTPPPVGTSYTVTADGQARQRYYRLRQ